MGSVVPTRVETDTPIILYSVMVDLQKIPDPAVSTSSHGQAKVLSSHDWQRIVTVGEISTRFCLTMGTATWQCLGGNDDKPY